MIVKIVNTINISKKEKKERLSRQLFLLRAYKNEKFLCLKIKTFSVVLQSPKNCMRKNSPCEQMRMPMIMRTKRDLHADEN